MARELTPLKVKIGTKATGGAKYPDFNKLTVVRDSNTDWSKYVDIYGDGWHYDKKCGHKEEDETSPVGQQWGVLLVPEQFAQEAETMYPESCEIMEEPAFETFYDERAHAHEPDEEIDNDILDGIKKKQDLGQTLTQQQVDAIDATTDERGIRKNKRRKWADYKSMKGMSVKPGIMTTKPAKEQF